MKKKEEINIHTFTLKAQKKPEVDVGKLTKPENKEKPNDNNRNDK